MKHIFEKLMKRSATLPMIVIATTAMAVGPRHAILNSQIQNSEAPQDTVTEYRHLPGEIRDTLSHDALKRLQEQQRMATQYQIRMLARSYGDSVVLRWLAPDYVGWHYLNNVGVTIVRQAVDGSESVILAEALKPMPLEQALSLYPESDSLARMGIGMVYNRKQSDPYDQKDPIGEAGNLFGIHSDQQIQFGMAGLVAEWRADVADIMGLRYVDRDVKKGEKYQYIVMPAVTDTTGHVILTPAIDEVENNPYKPEPFDVALADSVTAPSTVMLAWPVTNHSSFEIERRQVSESGDGNGDWQRVNGKPYVAMMDLDASDTCLYMDNVPEPGTYEYRIIAHDAFGDLTEPSKPHSVIMPDLIPPLAPFVTGIFLNRKQESPISQPEIYAEIHWKKEIIEEDLVGYMLFYRHNRITKGEWWQLSKEHAAPTDTICEVDVSSLSTGEICIGAYDKAGNVSYSFFQTIRIDDIYPPHIPTGLKAETDAEEGTITLTWSPVTDLDLKYYEVSFANDSTHSFMVRSDGQVTDTCFVDTVFMEANQKYIYYKVRAVDETGNESQPSQMLQVMRPSNVPPITAHIDSAYTDENGVYMRWVCSDEKQVARHHVLRRLDTEEEWTVLRVCDADSVKAAGDYIEMVDVPPVNFQHEYCYAIESFNTSNISSGLSMQYMTLYRGPLYFDCGLKLYASYEPTSGETRLVWDINQEPPYDGEWYFCIYRREPDKEQPTFFMSARKEDRDHIDYVLQPGEQTEYYIYVSYPDGRRSKRSNSVILTVPPKEY